MSDYGFELDDVIDAHRERLAWERDALREFAEVCETTVSEDARIARNQHETHVTWGYRNECGFIDDGDWRQHG